MGVRVVRLLKYTLQIMHLLLGVIMVVLGLVEFSVEPPLFDILGPSGSRPALPVEVFNFSVANNENRKVFGRVMDLPILALFLCYFMALVWLKCRGVLAWVMSSCMVAAILLVVAVNEGLASNDLLQWRFLEGRTVIIALDVLILSFAWTTVVMVLLIVRNWFPFKTSKGPVVTRVDKAVAILFNIAALYVVLTLCFFIWFSRLYDSWACIQGAGDVLLLCQLTNQIQCYQCSSDQADLCHDVGLADCVDHLEAEPFHCLSPLYTIDNPNGFCVFNYNIGFFTFVTVFAYVGGIYFFCRTIFKALFKCVKVVGMIAVKYCQRLCAKTRTSLVDESLSLSKDRISLLASLPQDYASTNLARSTKE